VSRILQLLAAASLAFAATSARAADPAQLECPLTSLTAEQRRALDAYIAEQGGSQDPRILAYGRAVEQCAARFHWSQRAQAAASGWGFASAAVQHMRLRIRERGVDPRALEEMVLADRTLLGAAFGSEAQRRALDAFIRGNLARVEALANAARPSDDQLKMWLGAFIAARAIRDSTREAYLAS
jgi:hypothetical protein